RRQDHAADHPHPPHGRGRRGRAGGAPRHLQARAGHAAAAQARRERLDRSSAMTTPGPKSTPTIEKVRTVAPKLAELTEGVLFGDVGERPGLSKRDRSMITISALIALNRTEQLRTHLVRALDNGVTKDEIVEVITHLAFYSGWPTAMSASLLAKEIFEAKR